MILNLPEVNTVQSQKTSGRIALQKKELPPSFHCGGQVGG